jgi:hypothetical protein
MRYWMNHLAGLRRVKPMLAGHQIDACRLRELGLREAKLAILFAELIAHLLFRLNAIAAFNGVEVLQTIDHDQSKEHAGGRAEDAHFAHAHRIGRLDQAGVVKVAGEVELRSAHAAPAQGLLCE